MRRVLTDQLASQAVTIEGRTAIPFVISTMDTAKHRQWNWTMVAMGFVGKNIECADQLLRESDRDTSAARTKYAPNRPGHYLFHDSGSSDSTASGYGL